MKGSNMPGGSVGHGLLARQPGEFRGGDEFVALRPQGIDQLRQSLDGLGPVAARIVQQDDIAVAVGVEGRNLLYDAVDDRLRRWPQPIVRVDAQPDGDEAHALRQRDRLELVHRRRVGIAEERRPEQPHRMAGNGLEQAARRVDLELRHALRQIDDVRMRECMIADVLAFLIFAFDDVRIGAGILTDDEERGVDVLRFENVEDLRRERGIRPVVEGEHQLFWLRTEPLDDKGGRQNFVGLVDDVAGFRIKLEDALTRRRLRRNMQDFALILEIDFLRRRNRLQLIRRRGIVRAAENRPDRRVFGAEAPDRIARRPINIGGVDFVEGGDSVEEPDVMRLAAVVPCR